jgi:hypothetical protein
MSFIWWWWWVVFSSMKSSTTEFHLGDKVTEKSEKFLMPIINSSVHFLQRSYLLENNFAFQNLGSYGLSYHVNIQTIYAAFNIQKC